MLKTTPFHPRTAALCESHAWRRWSGYVVASSYDLVHEREYHAIRSSAALLDISPLYKYRVIGPISNLPGFGQAFSCKPGSAMVRPEKQRCEVW